MGIYLYNEIELPALPEWDKETYPYAIISEGIGAGLFVSKEPFTYGKFGAYGNMVILPAGRMLSTYDFSSWSDFSTQTAQQGTLSASWSNHDIINTIDGSVYLPASYPIDAETGEEIHDYEIGGEPEQPENRTEWQKQDAYKHNTEWNGKTFYRVMGGKWVKQDAVVSQVVEVEPDVPDPDVPEPEKPTNWLTFSSAEPFTIGVANAKKNWGGTLEYSTDTTTWSEWDGTAAVASAEHDGEQRVYMRGTGNSVITGSSNNYRWVLTGSNIACNGNIESLLDYETVANGEPPVMAAHCYSYMFSGCTSLTRTPELPAITLATYCYSYMFQGCTSLTGAPELPATTLASYCYYYMFYGCTSLTSAPALPATTLASSCYGSMFYGCYSLETLPKLPATTLEEDCYSWMFCDCGRIRISSTQSDEYSNEYRIPTDGTGNTASDALYYMFYGTGGTFKGTPSINTTYYTANEVV